MKINMNDYVEVILNDKGFQILTDLHNSFVGEIPSYKLMDINDMKVKYPDGVYKKQLWVLFETFGPYISLGSQVPFETDIEHLQNQNK